MLEIQELNTVSSYKPISGVLLDVYKVVIEKNISRQEAIYSFKKNTGKTNFKVPYKRLKDKLLQGILENSFNNLTKVQKQHVDVIKKYAEAKILLILHKKIAGVKIAEEVFKKAEWLGLIDIAFTLSKDLQVHFGAIKEKNKKFEYYTKKAFQLKLFLDAEYHIQCLYFEIENLHNKNKPLTFLRKKLDEFHPNLSKISTYKFRLFYHQAKNLIADEFSDKAAILKNTKEALAYFDSQNTPLPYTTRWMFLINLVPIYLNQKDHIQTERTLNACLSLPTKGSFNWHLTLLYKALYGFNTNKPYIALNAWQKAHSIPKKFDSPIITERWQMVEAYLAFYGKIGRIEYPRTFRLYRFLNTIQRNRADNPQKANLLVLEFIHLLVDSKYKQYTEKTFSLDQKIAKNFNQQTFRRTKYFLRSLKGILKGNFHPVGALRHAQPHLTKMHAFANDLDLNVLDREVVPYEFLWEELHAILEKNRGKRKRLV